MCLEAECAFSRQKPTLVCALEAEYNPDGWLGPLCLDNVVACDFSDRHKLDDEWCKLRDKLTQMKLAVNDSDKAVSPETSAEGYIVFCKTIT